MKRILPLTILTGIALTLSSCATLFTGTTQSVTIDSQPQGANIIVDGKLVGTTPARVRLDRDLNAIFDDGKFIRLEKDGIQKLYKYDLRNGKSEVLIDAVVIGYQVWYNDNTLLTSVLEDGGLSLYKSDIKSQKHTKLDANIGRSLHNIPNTDLVSYISKSNDKSWTVNSIHPVTGEIKVISSTLANSEDMCWLPNGTILMGQGSKLYLIDPEQETSWNEVLDLEKFELKNISRIIASPDGSKLAVVAEGGKEIIDPNTKLEHTLENVAWLSGNWKGEALGGIVEENWSSPSGGSMMATFKLLKDDKVVFYEIEIIREIENTLVLQLKHFNNDLKGWEAKDDTVDFPLTEITPNKITFDGMSFEKVNDNEMIVSVVTRQKDGTVDTLKFSYKKD